MPSVHLSIEFYHFRIQAIQFSSLYAREPGENLPHRLTAGLQISTTATRLQEILIMQWTALVIDQKYVFGTLTLELLLLLISFILNPPSSGYAGYHY